MSFRNAYGHSHSENGWRMCNRDECDIPRIPNLFLVDTAPLRRGAPHTILGAWLKWYDLNVEEIGSPVWGWSNTNDVANSNHLSGTAVDVNAPKYPWGRRVMPADRIAKIRRGLALFEGSVFWGADWSRADEMHYQMAWREGDQRNEAFAAKLRAGHLGIYGTAPKPPTPTAPQEEPMSAADVEALKKYIDERITNPIGSDVKDIRQQLTGGRDAGEYPGWPQLDNKTVVDAIAKLDERLKKLEGK
ncbi:endolysin [Rhodococcus sp. 15-649-1-2]|nr:M15 family metallopeptidase [Rhodococcus sp. 15-649-1-2]OZE88025.1 endolysin [Rhodococcus sp. 15-649-1-2]